MLLCMCVYLGFQFNAWFGRRLLLLLLTWGFCNWLIRTRGSSLPMLRQPWFTSLCLWFFVLRSVDWFLRGWWGWCINSMKDVLLVLIRRRNDTKRTSLLYRFLQATQRRGATAPRNTTEFFCIPVWLYTTSFNFPTFSIQHYIEINGKGMLFGRHLDIFKCPAFFAWCLRRY